MTEPDVALTDYALVLECGLFVVLLSRMRAGEPQLGRWFLAFFASASAAPLFGGTVHGFFLDPESWGQAVFWRATLLAVGATTFATWGIGATLVLPPRARRWAIAAATVQFVACSGYILFVTQEFAFAVANYVPAVALLLVSLGVRSRRERSSAVLAGIFGVILSLVAASLQQLGVAVHPVYFNHNALYHVLQAAGLFLIFRCGAWLVRREAGREKNMRLRA